MARPTKMSVQKRLREQKKADAAERKRAAKRGGDGAEKAAGGQVAERSDLESYGVIPTFSDAK
jgi:hypothetical protein